MKRYSQENIDELANILKNDGVISVPTDTVYGVCARINSKKAHDKIMEVKNRPSYKLLPIMCADEEQIKSISIVNENASLIIKNFMPGPITLVLPIKIELPYYINNGEKTLAIRMATSDFLKELIKKVGSPIFMSSANQSGEKTCQTLDEIEKSCPKLDGMVEGAVTFGKASTIVDCSKDDINILRDGPISIEQILNVLKK